MATDNLTPRTIEIQLTKGYVAIVDEQDADLKLSKWHVVSSGDIVKYAVRRYVNSGKELVVRMHRVVLEREIGRPLQKGEYCDHINNNSLDNRRDNLRVANRFDNAHNRKTGRDNTSGYKGAYLQRGKWRAIISANKKRFNLGYFDTPEEAHKAYCEAAIKLHGDFAKFE